MGLFENINIWIEASIFCGFLIAFIIRNVIRITKNKFLNLIFYMVLYSFIDFAIVIIDGTKKLLISPFIFEYHILYPLIVLFIISLIIREKKKSYFSKK